MYSMFLTFPFLFEFFPPTLLSWLRIEAEGNHEPRLNGLNAEKPSWLKQSSITELMLSTQKANFQI